ncbi:MAG: DeoR/GlpR family DNA-binding transcription regulator [Lachnospiraceae bacterium]|nr:DeoR/GlpR family DNA-binding transcription regulator [Lachnospiraceae bacterium]
MRYSFLERKKYIIEQLEANGQVDTAELSKKLHVSKETLRKDLSELEKENVLTRTHGGAARSEGVSPLFERTSYRKKLATREKEAICKKAASLIENEDTIFIDCSTTNFSLLKYVNPAYTLTVITNSLQVVMESENILSPNVTIILVGGLFKKDFYMCAGDMAMDMIRPFHPNKSFFSFVGIDEDGTLFDANMHGAEVKRHFLHNSEKIIMLMDHSKIGKKGGVCMTNVDQADALVTDSHLSERDKAILNKYPTTVLIAD